MIDPVDKVQAVLNRPLIGKTVVKTKRTKTGETTTTTAFNVTLGEVATVVVIGGVVYVVWLKGRDLIAWINGLPGWFASPFVSVGKAIDTGVKSVQHTGAQYGGNGTPDPFPILDPSKWRFW